MTLAPYFAAPLFIKVHIISALAVMTLSPLQYWGPRKGSMAHRAAGYAWLLAMLVVAISSFWIKTDFPLQVFGYGPIHLLSLMTLYSVLAIPYYARAQRDRPSHGGEGNVDRLLAGGTLHVHAAAHHVADACGIKQTYPQFRPVRIRFLWRNRLEQCVESRARR